MKKKNTVTLAWFKNWANEYDNTLGRVQRHHNLLNLVVQASGVKDGDRVLDIGCGTGLLSLKFLDKADCSVYGIDSSPAMLAIFKDKIHKLKLSARATAALMSAEKIRLANGSFDIAASTVTLHHVVNKPPALAGIYRALKKGGKLVIGDIDMDTTGDVRDPRRLVRILTYLQEEFVLALKEGGVQAFSRLYDNGKKHILNDGEYCVSFHQWKTLCLGAGFKTVRVQPLPGFAWFKVLTAVK